MIVGVNKWYPFVLPVQHDIKSVQFEKAVEKNNEEYKQALEGLKEAHKTHELEVELYDKRARQNTIELGMFEDRRRFQIFV
jgi:hypothetical protein